MTDMSVSLKHTARSMIRKLINGLPLQIILIAAAFTITMPVIAQEQNIREDAATISVWTDNGLSISLNRSDGSVRAVSVGGKTYRSSPAPLVRFEEVIEKTGAANLLGEWDKAAWGVEPGDSPDDPWLKAPGSSDKKPSRSITLNQSVPAPIIVSGSCKYEAVGEAEGWMNRNLAINVNCEHAGGGETPEQSVYFGQYNHGPQFNSKVICPDRPVSTLKLELTAADAKSTAWFKDVSVVPAEYRITSPRDKCERLDARVVQDFEIPESAIHGKLTLQPVKDYIEVRCRFQSHQKTDRAISAYVVIPFDAVGGIWYDDVRRSRKIEAGRIYRNSAWYGAGRSDYYSQYPICAVTTTDGAGLALGTALDEPRVLEMEYDAGRKELRIRYDLGLSPDAGRWANSGSFTSYIFPFDAKDGFRGAADKFHGISKWAFKNRVERQGLWIAFLTPQSVPGGWEDFHFRFVEAVGNIGWEEKQGMYSLRYADPWIHSHEFPPDRQPEDVKGPIDPMVTVETAQRLAKDRSALNPPELCERYAAFLGCYIEDNWGKPQGYFFRGARNENMMIVNPNPNLPTPEGANFCIGALDSEINRESGLIWKQWSIDGWTTYRASEKPFIEIDTRHKTSGKQSVRFDPVRSKGYWMHYTRGMNQTVYHDAGDSGLFEFSFQARGRDIPQDGTRMEWTVEFQSEDDKTERHVFKLDGLTNEWKKYSFKLQPKLKPAAIYVVLVCNPWTPDPSTIWIDDVSLVAEGNPRKNLLVNGDLEKAELMSGEIGGVYLDIMECYTNNINYRRGHWPYAEEPLTFDTARKPGLQQQFSHVSYAKNMAEYVRLRDKILFANCSPATVFGAPYLDVMGAEDHWMRGGVWSPRPDASFNFDRFMCGTKPFCILNYADFDLVHLEKYIKRCMFYGVFPGIISSSATSGKWYWTNAVRVKRDRPVFAKYMPLIVKVAESGWCPLTLAVSDNENIWLERFGDKEGVYITLFNPTSEKQSAKITLDPRLGLTNRSKLVDESGGGRIALTRGKGEAFFNMSIAPEDVKVIKLMR